MKTERMMDAQLRNTQSIQIISFLSMIGGIMDKEILKEIFGSIALFAGLYVMTVLAFCL